MRPFPVSARERADKREAMRGRARADALVARGCLSLKCAGQAMAARGTPQHRSDPLGCRGGPTNCLCECHDDEGSAVLV